MSIEIIDIQDDVGGFGLGTTILFKYTDAAGASHDLQYENWFTGNGGGTDIYHRDTSITWSLEGLPGTDENWEVLEGLLIEFLDAVRDLYDTKFAEVNRLKQQLVEDTLIESDLLAKDDKYEDL